MPRRPRRVDPPFSDAVIAVADPEVHPTSLQMSTSDREMAFALAYLGPAKFNKGEAARIVGLSSSQIATDYLLKPRVQAIIRAHFRSASASAEETIAFLSDVMRDQVPGTRAMLKDRVTAAQAIMRGHIAAAALAKVPEPEPKKPERDYSALTTEELERYLELEDKILRQEGSRDEVPEMRKALLAPGATGGSADPADPPDDPDHDL